MAKKCIVCAKYYNIGDNRSFHRIPKGDRGKTWIEALGLNKKCVKYLYVCSDHFIQEDFHLTTVGGRCLKLSAIPVASREECTKLNTAERTIFQENEHKIDKKVLAHITDHEKSTSSNLSASHSSILTASPSSTLSGSSSNVPPFSKNECPQDTTPLSLLSEQNFLPIRGECNILYQSESSTDTVRSTSELIVSSPNKSIPECVNPSTKAHTKRQIQKKIPEGDRGKTWIEALCLNKKCVKYLFVCSDHFIQKDSHLTTVGGRCLKLSAIPVASREECGELNTAERTIFQENEHKIGKKVLADIPDHEKSTSLTLSASHSSTLTASPSSTLSASSSTLSASSSNVPPFNKNECLQDTTPISLLSEHNFHPIRGECNIFYQSESSTDIVRSTSELIVSSPNKSIPECVNPSTKAHTKGQNQNKRKCSLSGTENVRTKELSSYRYIGDFSNTDMANPAKALKFRELSLKVIEQQRKKIKIISQAKDRYEQRLISMKHLLNDLQTKT